MSSTMRGWIITLVIFAVVVAGALWYVAEEKVNGDAQDRRNAECFADPTTC